MTEWKALPGGVLAYGDTGFEIREMPEEKHEMYALMLFDPQGRKITSAGYGGLGYLKRTGMDAARDAAEFRGGPPVPPHPPRDGDGVGPDRSPTPTPVPSLVKTS